MPTYLVERRLPDLTEAHRSVLGHVLGEASRRLSSEGRSIRYLGTLVVPGRARCLCLFDAPDVDLVETVNEAALVPFDSIVEAVCLPIAGAGAADASDTPHGRRGEQ